MIYLFDLDGTVINSEKRHTILLERLLKEHEIEVTKEQLDGYLPAKKDGMNTWGYLVDVIGTDQETAGAIAEEWVRQIESEELLKTDTLYEDTLACLRKAHDKGKIIYATARQNGQGTFRELERLGIKPYAVGMLISVPAKGAEGKKELIENVRQAYPEEELVVVGDTEVDADAIEGIEGDITLYLVHRGFRSKTFWEARGVETHSDLSEL